MRRYGIVLALAGLVVFCGQAPAATVSIPGVFGTGLDDYGNLLPAGALDPHFTLISSDAGVVLPSGHPYTVATSGPYNNPAWPFWNGVWTGNTASSQWIAPQAYYYGGYRVPSGPADPGGWYTFRLEFYLPDQLAVDTAQIVGAWTADNLGGIYLNSVYQPDLYTPPPGGGPWGTSTHSCMDADGGCFQAMHAFDISSGFVVGVNYLDFRILNDSVNLTSNPAGFQVTMTGTMESIPEPASAALGVTGLVLLALYRRRRRSV
jgi:MYXO-CTERM domain-containing protein